jgi:tetratricopeptide (TPR) repeat protein
VFAAVAPDRPLDDVADDVSWLLDRAATYRQALGDPRPALPLFQRAYALDRNRMGDDHPDTLAKAINLALDLHALGEYERARILDEDTLAWQDHDADNGSIRADAGRSGRQIRGRPPRLLFSSELRDPMAAVMGRLEG